MCIIGKEEEEETGAGEMRGCKVLGAGHTKTIRDAGTNAGTGQGGRARRPGPHAGTGTP